VICGTAGRAGLTGTILGIVFAVVCFASPAFALEPVPGNACSAANQWLWAGAPQNGGVLNGMFCNGSTWQSGINFQSTGNVGIGTTTPAARFDVAGPVKLGSAGTAFMAMGACTVASYTPTNTASNQTCTGVPAWGLVSVYCSPSTAFSTPNTTVINASATGIANQIAVNLKVANTNAMTLTCRWTEPCQTVLSQWTLQTAANAFDWRTIAYGNSTFVAVAASGDGVHQAMTSPDGVTWTARAMPNQYWTSITYGGGLFVVVSGNPGTPQVATSPDGVTWTTRTTPNSSNGWSSVTYGGGLFVAVSGGSTNYVMTSPNGITWTERTAASTDPWNAVTYGGGLFVAVSGSGTTYGAMSSPDGVTWTGRTLQTDYWSPVTYGNGMFAAASYEAASSPDGINWTIRATPTSGMGSITYGGGLFVAVGNGGTYPVMISPDGIAWMAGTVPEATNGWSSVTYGNGTFVAVANSGTHRVMTSTPSPGCP
jgi:hypothetical protein